MCSFSSKCMFDGKPWTDSQLLQEQETNQVRSIWITLWAQPDAEQRPSAIWNVDGEPIWVFSLQRRPTILLHPFWASNCRHLKNVWIIFISTVIHLYVYAIHITWKYVGFCYKNQTSAGEIQQCTLRFKISSAVSSKRQQKALLPWEQEESYVRAQLCP